MEAPAIVVVRDRIAATDHCSFRRELWRWRDAVAGLYVEPSPRPDLHAQALRTLLRLETSAAVQVASLTA